MNADRQAGHCGVCGERWSACRCEETACLGCGCPADDHDARDHCSRCGSTCAPEAAA